MKVESFFLMTTEETIPKGLANPVTKMNELNQTIAQNQDPNSIRPSEIIANMNPKQNLISNAGNSSDPKHTKTPLSTRLIFPGTSFPEQESCSSTTTPAVLNPTFLTEVEKAAELAKRTADASRAAKITELQKLRENQGKLMEQIDVLRRARETAPEPSRTESTSAAALACTQPLTTPAPVLRPANPSVTTHALVVGTVNPPVPTPAPVVRPANPPAQTPAPVVRPANPPVTTPAPALVERSIDELFRDISTYRIQELNIVLRDLGLSKGGNKAVLVDRIRSFINNAYQIDSYKTSICRAIDRANM
jgi:hypothetical protein